ncbi:MAG: DUF4397 domain-containing protein [Clostridia bacterium]|nr:DUF4397 domain-containing protein [Clostridia bacterium]
MFERYCYFPYDPYNRAPSDISYIRILHASPGAPTVDIYANENIIARGLVYKGFTPYIRVNTGVYNINVFPSGQTSNPVLSTSINIPPQSVMTVAAAGRPAELSLFPINEPFVPTTQGKAYVRFVHLSPDTPSVDITLPNGTILFSNVAYKGITEYIPVDPGTYILEARPTSTEVIALYVPNITLRADRFYTVYAVGLSGGTPSLQALIPLDGNSYIKF